MLAPDYPVQTERLLLRPLDVDGDVEAVHAYHSLPDVCRYVPFSPRSRSEVTEWMAARRSTLDEAGQALFVGVEMAATGQLVGDLMLAWKSEEHGCGELGYTFHPNVRGHGYATEACNALLRLAFDGLGLHRVTARIDARNDASAAVVRRLGMREEAHLVENEWFKGEWTDEIDFAILATEWTARQASA